MVQISLFDIFPPPEPIIGEAQTLSPLDVLLFTPTSAAVRTGEKLTGSLLSNLSKFFGSKAIIPTERGLITVAETVGSRAPGAPFKLSGGLTRTSTSGLTSAATSQAPKTSITFPKLFSSSPANKNLALGTAGLGSIFGTTALLTQTQGGQDFSQDVNDNIKSVSNFINQNPLIVAGGLVLGAILVLK